MTVAAQWLTVCLSAVFDKLLSGHGAGPYYSVPFYTLHKLMAGLLDQYVHAGSKLAFELVKRMAGWVHASVEKCIATGGQDLWQRVLLTEWGGMNDVLYNLYSHTKDPLHLATGRRFNGWVFSQPLADGIDTLGSLPFPHANFHLPEVIGFARAYELTGNSTDSLIANNFFDELTANHSYSTGAASSLHGHLRCLHTAPVRCSVVVMLCELQGEATAGSAGSSLVT